jgi:divalent metal cation (Fe/Co/Zn/Cd) transporter
VICHVGYEVTTEIVSHLMDAVDPTLLNRTQAGVSTVPGVESIQVRGRWTGRTLRLVVQAALDSTLTLGATNSIALAVESAVFDSVKEARVVEVQVVPDHP